MEDREKIETALLGAGKRLIPCEAWASFRCADGTRGQYGFLTKDGLMDFLRGVAAARRPGFKITEASHEQFHVPLPDKG